jgi:nicotinate-nucleotide adenylyltransferase
MKIGLFFGSFSPMHVGHLAIAQYMVDYTEIERVLFVVSPKNPLKDDTKLWNKDLRLELARYSIFDNEDFGVTDIEFNLPTPSYTYDTLREIRNEDAQNEFSIIMGSDSLNSLDKWKEYEVLLEENKFFVYTRPGHEEPKFGDHKNVTLVKSMLLEISSTTIRQKVKKGRSVKYLVRDEVYEMIVEK